MVQFWFSIEPLRPRGRLESGSDSRPARLAMAVGAFSCHGSGFQEICDDGRVVADYPGVDFETRKQPTTGIAGDRVRAGLQRLSDLAPGEEGGVKFI